MKISEKGKHLIKFFEAFKSKPYIDAVGIATIGWGFTYYPDGKKVTMKDNAITQSQADIILDSIIDMDFAKYVPQNTNQNQFDALCSLCYNIGSRSFTNSTLAKKVLKNPNDESIKDEFLKWNKGRRNGQLVTLQGLATRRRQEANLYFEPVKQ